MKKHIREICYGWQGAFMVVLALLLASCKLSAPAGSKSTAAGPEAIYTAAAQTANARLQERLAQTSAVASQAPVEPTVAPPSPTTEAAVITPTLPAATTAVAPPTEAPVAPGDDKAEFIEDVNIPDDTAFTPGKAFKKTWKIENTGKITWTSDYALVFVDGDLMGASPAVPMPQKVDPWEKVQISVDMVAPASPGKYTSYWKLRNADGKIFGFGSTGNEAIWVQIVVQSSLASGEATSTVMGDQVVGAVSLSVDNPAAGGCPHTFIFTALIALNKAASLTYSLEGGDNAGNQIRLPLPATRNLDAGAHPVVYELTFSENMVGWARLRIARPEQVFSNQVNFTLTCG